jgi:VIT1/CCC1 family predicted Fe2+/Mn2+ transporter
MLKSFFNNFNEKEITEHILYQKLAKRSKGKNAEILKTISDDELQHYLFWKKYTQKDFRPNQVSVYIYLVFCIIFGLTFMLKLMEGGEENAQDAYCKISNEIPEVKELMWDEHNHENLLLNMINEKRLDYISSIVQGLNDALIGLMGALAGLTFALQETHLIGFAGLISGIAQFLSSSASEMNVYFTNKTQENKQALKDSIISGVVYVFTVIFLVLPYFIFTNYMVALTITMLNVGVIIIFFTFYVSVVRELPLKKMFPPMVLITLGIGSLSFIIGWIANKILNF